MKTSFLSLLTAGLTMFAPVLNAATMTTETSFIFSFTVVNGTQVQDLQLDPFTGSPDSLTGASLEFNSRIVAQNVSTDEHSAGVRRPDLTLLGISLNPSGDEIFAFSSDLFASGMTAADFIGGPVTFELVGSADGGSYTALWYAGTGVPGLGAEPYGSVRLVYEYDDTAAIPLPAAVPLLLAALGGLAGLRMRRSGALPR
jgi:hypothetical protein